MFFALGLPPGACGPGAEGAAVEQSGQEVLLRHLLQPPLRQEVLAHGVLQEVAARRADEVGRAHEEGVVQQHMARRAGKHLHAQVGRERDPAAEHGRHEAQAGEEVDREDDEDDAFVGQGKGVCARHPDDADHPQPANQRRRAGGPLQPGAQPGQVGGESGQGQRGHDQAQAQRQHLGAHGLGQADGVKQCKKQEHRCRHQQRPAHARQERIGVVAPEHVLQPIGKSQLPHAGGLLGRGVVHWFPVSMGRSF